MYTRNSWQRLAITGVALALSVIAAIPAIGQEARLPRAKSPLTLFSFESADSAKRWTGMKSEVTTAHHSEGSSALAITLPKWAGGRAEQYLAVRTDWADGQGYAEKDWSHYGKVSFDAWVDGTQPLQIMVDLRTNPNQDGWTKELMVEPGQKNHFELALQDANDVIDLTNVKTIVVYSIRPAEDTKLTIDNFTLLPGDKMPIADFDLVYPNYREMIMPKVANIKATLELRAAEYDLQPSELEFMLTAVGGSVKSSNSVRPSGDKTTISVPAGTLPYGRVKLTALVKNSKTGKILSSRDWTLSKLTETQRSKLKVYIDENNNTIADGKPFFPIGWFDDARLDHLAEFIDSPFNTVLNYGVNNRSKSYMRNYLDVLQKHDMKLIYCMNDIYPTATYLDNTGWEGVYGNDNIAHAVVNAYKDHPAVLAWYLNDERPKELMPQLEGYYHRVRNDDPNRPCYIIIYQLPELKYFPTTTDIMGVDRYPIPMDPVTKVSDEMHVSHAAVKGHKPTYAVIQAFGWYQYNDAFPDRGRTPTEEDLKAGRAPSYDEMRCMTYLALANGAKGILYYCYYDTHVLPQYAEMWTGLKKIGAEVKVLSPILLSPSDLGTVECSPADSGVQTLLKELDGQQYLIAVNSQNKPCTVTFDLKRPLPAKMGVYFENRFAMQVSGSKLTDTFKPLEAHVYDIGRIRR